jgi:hypothetical protein
VRRARPTTFNGNAIHLMDGSRCCANGYGAYSSGEKQSLPVLNLSREVTTFQTIGSKQSAATYFWAGRSARMGNTSLLAVSLRSARQEERGTGNGTAVYSFGDADCAGTIPAHGTPQKNTRGKLRRTEYKDVTHQAERCREWWRERLLVATTTPTKRCRSIRGQKSFYRFDLSTMKRIPASPPYTTVMTKMGSAIRFAVECIFGCQRASSTVVKAAAPRKPGGAVGGRPHPTAPLLNQVESRPMSR